MRDALAALQPEKATVGKLMATLPWLGWDFQLPSGPGAVVDGDTYRELLNTHRPERFDWHAEAAEHVFSYTKDDARHSVYYPSLKGLAERLGVLRNLGVGIALWELGTGLDYFFDLL
jgi:chitinase domain-containing protein 1